ncbi:MAG: ParB/RepB/Spo0J family partition protein, partial [Spirochaetales bacterium]
MSKGGLGKGLGALLSEAETETGMHTNPTNTKNNNAKGTKANNADIFLDIDLLKPNPHQPRLEFDEKALQELADSVAIHGVIQSVLVEEGDNGDYYIIAGERRTRAARIAGLKKIPVRIQKFSDVKKLEVALIENIQRENLNPLEEAKAYHKLMELSGDNQEGIAKRVGKNRSTVANTLRLLKLPEDMQKALLDGVLSSGHARAVLSVINPSDQRILFARITGSGLSVREAELQAGLMNAGNKSQKNPKKKSAE